MEKIPWAIKFFLLLTISLGVYSADSVTLEKENLGLRWSKYSKSEKNNIYRLLNILNRSKWAKKLISDASVKASRDGKKLVDIFQMGQNSLTDTTVIRSFTVDRPYDIEYKTKSRIVLNYELNTLDAALDAAHELVHYTYRDSFNPYTNKLNLPGFVHSTIEGKGGEADAYVMECRVLHELFSKNVGERYHCKEILDRNGRLSRAQAVKKFYQIGNYHDFFEDKMAHLGIDRGLFPMINDDTPIFISSAYSVPYPIAAYQEYQIVSERVCKNQKKQLAYMAESVKRVPASVRLKSEAYIEYSKLKNHYLKKCLK